MTAMLGRRSDKRYRLTEPADGVVRFYRDVIVERHGDEWIAIGREPAVAGETLVLDVLDLDEGAPQGRFVVCVIESRPVLVDGDVRHRIRLHDSQPATALFDEPITRG
jgi:hypothetical protein